MNQEIKLVTRFDKDGNGWLNNTERKAAREYLKKEASGRPGGFGRGPGGFRPGGAEANQEPAPSIIIPKKATTII